MADPPRAWSGPQAGLQAPQAGPLAPQAGPLGPRVDRERLSAWLSEQRWFAAKSRTPTALEVIEEAVIDDGLSLALLMVHYATGNHDIYQVLLGEDAGGVAFDVLTEPAPARALLEAIEQGREIEAAHGGFYFRHVDAVDGAVDEAVRAMGAEQSNSSIVFGDRLVLKLFRRLESGINPELEMLRFLTAGGYPNIAPLYGWYEYEGEALAGTLAIAQRFVHDGTDGWELALDEIPRDPAAFLDRLEALGVATAKLHSVLSSDAGDPAFSPEESSTELLSLLRATLDEGVERLYAHLPEDPRLEPIRGLEQEIRELISATPQTPGGRRIRIHGDYHLGQTLHTPDGWRLLDFEGEPASPLTARRNKRSPLRDVACMLRSFSYATSAVGLQRGLEAPDGFEAGARQTFIEAYLAEVEPSLVPSSRGQLDSLLAIFELEKALYELRYELDNRPDWVPIPVAGIARLVLGAGA
jgi:maltokinase